MNRSNARVRQTHRWLSIAFTAGVLINVFAVQGGEPPVWVYFLAGAPLALLWLTGMYLFVLPYAIRWRSTRHTME